MEKMLFETIGTNIRLSRKQWGDKIAYISNYPGLLEEVLKYTWTLCGKKHSYLRSSKLNKSLHEFVLEFLYGYENLKHLLSPNNIIEHLDNDGLNCTYENLHILSEDLNKAKAFTIDKNKNTEPFPTFIADVFYTHKEKYFQLQITFNRDIFIGMYGNYIEAFFLRYKTFNDLFIDWFYILNHKNGDFNLNQFRTQILAKERPRLILHEDEKDYAIIERDGKLYFRLDPDGGSKATCICKTTYKNLEGKY